MRNPKSTLPRLVFGEAENKTARQFPRSFGDPGNDAGPKCGVVYHFEEDSYQAKSRICKFGQITIGAKSHSGVVAELEKSNCLSLGLSVFGNSTDIATNGIGQWSASKTIFLGAYERRVIWKSDMQSFGVIFFDRGKMHDVFSVMKLDEGGNLCSTYIEKTRLIPAYWQQINFHEIFYSLFHLVDVIFPDTSHMERIGLDEIFYRTAARFISSGFTNPINDPDGLHETKSQLALEKICETIKSTPGKPLNATEMEKIAGMSSRSLQLAFHRKFGCSPQEWQRNHRLDHARQILIQKNEPVSIKNISYELGFFSQQSFSRFYKERFGELPSETYKSSSRKK